MIRFIELFLLFGLFMAGCAYTRPAIEQTKKVTITEIDRDSMVKLPPDEAWLRAWLECDSTNQVVLRQIEQKDGELIKLSFALEQVQESIDKKDSGQNQPPTVEKPVQALFVTASIDSQAVYLAWKERHVLEQETNNPVYAKPKEPPWWEKIAMIAIGLTVLYFIILIIKLKLDTR